MIMVKPADPLQQAPTESTSALEADVVSVIILPDVIPCNVCQHEIPKSEAVIAEVTDYLLYFCGLDCYERWQKALESC